MYVFFFILDAYLISAGLFYWISCSTEEIVYAHYGLKYKDFFNLCTVFSLVLGRLAVNGENLLPNHPEGCPADIPARLPCFIAGK